MHDETFVLFPMIFFFFISDLALCNGTEVEGTTKKTILKFYDWGMTNFIEYIDISTLFYSVSHTGQPRSELRIKLNPIECFKGME